MKKAQLLHALARTDPINDNIKRNISLVLWTIQRKIRNLTKSDPIHKRTLFNFPTFAAHFIICHSLYRTFFTSRPDRSEHCTIDGTTGYCAAMMSSSTVLQTVQWWQNAYIIYKVNVDSAIRFVETVVRFHFKLDSLHTHTSLMQHSFKVRYYRGNDLFYTAMVTDVLILLLLKCHHQKFQTLWIFVFCHKVGSHLLIEKSNQ